MKLLLSLIVFALVHRSSLGQSMSFLCADRAMASGRVEYGSHDTDCDKFIQCRFNEAGYLEEQIQQCPFSTYWNNDTLTCTQADATYCPRDECVDRKNGWEYQGNHGNCRGYWSCEFGKSVAKCCPQGQHYNETYGGCEENYEPDDCMVTCLNDNLILAENETAVNETVDNESVCDKQVVATDPSWYQFYLPGHGLVRMPCGVGTVFDEAVCQCVAVSAPLKIQASKCTREVHLTFEDNEKDQSGKKNHITNHKVVIENGTAKFNGYDSYLAIPRFNNLEHASSIVIKVNYTSNHTKPGVARAIISNRGTCTDDKPSVLLSEDSTNVYFGVGTDNKIFTSTHIEHTDMLDSEMPSNKDIVYKYDGDSLTGSDGYNTTEVAVTGLIRPVKCPLYVGYSKDHAPFEGEIHELEIFLCVPDMD